MSDQTSPDADSPIVAIAIDDSLEELALVKHHVSVASDTPIIVHTFQRYAPALERLSKGDVDILLIDYDLGECSGLDALTKMRAAGFDVPAILMTEYGDEIVAVQALQGGFNDYLPKQRLNSENLRRSIANSLEKHKLQQSLTRYHEELASTARDLDARNAQLQSFHQAVAQELQAPLQAIQEFLSHVLDDEVTINPDHHISLTVARRACDRISLSLNDLLDTARLETGKLTVNRSQQPIAGVIEAVVTEFAHVASGKRIDLRTYSKTEDACAYFDEARVAQVLSNLIENALKFTDPGGRITIEVEEADGSVSQASHLSITVRDNGRGIPTNDRDRVFERLYQGPNEEASEPEVSGLGLGLNLCRELVALHEGEIQVESNKGEGSAFRFTLPTSA